MTHELPERTRTTRPYVVLQEFDLPDLLASLIPGLQLDDSVGALLYERIEEFSKDHGEVYVKVAVTESVKNAPAALRRGGQHMLRPVPESGLRPANREETVAIGVAVPVSSWSRDDGVRLRLDVEVGGQS